MQNIAHATFPALEKEGFGVLVGDRLHKNLRISAGFMVGFGPLNNVGT